MIFLSMVAAPSDRRLMVLTMKSLTALRSSPRVMSLQRAEELHA